MNVLALVSAIFESKIIKIANIRLLDNLKILLKQDIKLTDYAAWINKNGLYNYLIGVEDLTFDHKLNAITIKRSNDIMYISNYQNQFNSMAVEESDLIEYGSIPKLFLFKDDYLSSITPDMAHNYFITESISHLFFKLTPKALSKINAKKIDSFINKNLPKINKIRASFKQNPELIGAGSYGIAFKINDYQIIKLFIDNFSYIKAKQSYDRLFLNPEVARTEALIYDVGELGKFNNLTIYYYIQELMQHAYSPKIKYFGFDSLTTIIKHITDHLSAYNFNSIKKQIKEDTSKVKPIINFIIANIYTKILNECNEEIIAIDSHNENLKDTWLKSLIEEIIMKYITGRRDLHIGNIGITNSRVSDIDEGFGNVKINDKGTGNAEFRYFDPAAKNWANKTNTGIH